MIWKLSSGMWVSWSYVALQLTPAPNLLIVSSRRTREAGHVASHDLLWFVFCSTSVASMLIVDTRQRNAKRH